MQQPLHTSRNRFPNSGRNNLSSIGAQSINNNNNVNNTNNHNNNVNNVANNGVSIVSSKISLSNSVKHKLNDPLLVFRPFSPEGRVYDSHIVRPPVLPKSRDSIYGPASETPRKPNKKLTCPDNWIKTLNAPNFFETADFKTLLDVGVKETYCREFVERNKDRLWKFNLKYLNQTPRTVCDDMVGDSNFIGTMRNFYLKEQTLNLGASDKFAKSIKDDHLHAMGEITTDDYLASMTTSRTQREARITKLLAPRLVRPEFRRGYLHAEEYGNFSNFSGFVISNKGVGLDR